MELLEDCPVHLHHNFAQKYFTARVVADGTRKDNVSRIIHRTAEMMAAEESSPEHGSSEIYLKAVCIATTERLSPRIMIHRLKSFPQQSRTASSAMVEYALWTAVFLESSDQLTRWLKKAAEAPEPISKLADALRFAVSLGHDAMVKLILDHAASRHLEWMYERLRPAGRLLEDPSLATSELRRIYCLSPYNDLYMVGVEAALMYRRGNTIRCIIDHLIRDIEKIGPRVSFAQ